VAKQLTGVREVILKELIRCQSTGYPKDEFLDTLSGPEIKIKYPKWIIRLIIWILCLRGRFMRLDKSRNVYKPLRPTYVAFGMVEKIP
jgi:hypothetical protein